MAKRWTEEEKNLIKECYEKKLSIKDICLVLPDRTPASISNQAIKLSCIPWKRWTEEEDAIIKECYLRDMPISEINQILPHRTLDSIMSHAKKLGLKRNEKRLY